MEAIALCFTMMLVIVLFCIIDEATASGFGNEVDGHHNTAITGHHNNIGNVPFGGGINIRPSNYVDVTNTNDVANVNRVSNEINNKVSNDLSNINHNLNISDNYSSNSLSGSNSQSQSQSVSNSGNSHQSQGVYDSGNASQHQNASSNQSQSASNAGNAQNVSINTQKQYRNTPSTALFVPTPTSPCMATIGGSGMGPGIGISIAGSYINENCERLEVAKALSSIGQLDGALEVICSGKHVENVAACNEIRDRASIKTVELQLPTSKPAVSNTVSTSKAGAEPHYITVFGKQLRVEPRKTYY